MRQYVRPYVQTLGGREESAIFSWREIAGCFWATSVFLAANRVTIVAFEKEVR